MKGFRVERVLGLEGGKGGWWWGVHGGTPVQDRYLLFQFQLLVFYFPFSAFRFLLSAFRFLFISPLTLEGEPFRAGAYALLILNF